VKENRETPNIALSLDRVLYGFKYFLRYKKRESVSLSLMIDDLTNLLDTPFEEELSEAFVLIVLKYCKVDRKSVIDRFNSVTSADSLDLVISKWSKKGVDAEKVTWSLITYESCKHIKLVWLFANRLTRTFSDRSADDLLAWGWYGLRTALRNFDPSLGFKFSTYAAPKITGAIRDGVRGESPIPKRLSTFSRKVSALEEKLTQELGRVPSLAEIAERLDDEAEHLKLLPRLGVAASLDEMDDIDGERKVVSKALIDSSTNANPSLSVESLFQSMAIEKAIGKLPREEAEAVRLLVMDGVTPREARQITGVNARVLLSRKKRGLVLLKDMLNDWA
jgi:RNA polymerase sigma factor for flagellar operon FliA